MTDQIINKYLPWEKCLLWSISYQVTLCFLVFSAIYLERGGLTAQIVAEHFSTWDAQHYISIAQYGYAPSDSEGSELIVFFPGYPYLIRLLMSITTPLVAGFLVSTLASLLGHAIFMRWLSERGYTERRVKTLFVLFACSPITIYFTLIYSESLFLLESMLFLLLLHRKKYLGASLVGFFATLTRMPGALFIVPLAIEILYDSVPFKKKVTPLLWSLLCPCGVFVYWGINYFIHQDAFFYTLALNEHWEKAIRSPFARYFFELTHLSRLPREIQPGYGTLFVDILSMLVAPVALIAYCLKRWLSTNTSLIPFSLIVWSCTQVLMFLSQSFWVSSTRYLGLVILFYLLVEEVLTSTRLRYCAFLALMATSALFALITIHRFSIRCWIF